MFKALRAYRVSPLLICSLLTSSAGAELARAPVILDYRQVADTNSIHLLWAPGGNDDGTLDPEVVSYEVERKGNGSSEFTTVFTGDRYAMTYFDTVGLLSNLNWLNSTQPVTYRVRATTGDSAETLSDEVSITPAIPLFPLDEALDGKVRLAWLPSVVDGLAHGGYQVEKLESGSWVAAHTGYLPPTQETFVDLNTTTGVSRYRVRAFHGLPVAGLPFPVTLTSNEEEIEIRTTCEGQATDPAIPPLVVIEIGDRDADLNYDGDDIADALEECSEVIYEDLSGPGDDDGAYEPANGETSITGGCILRALPVTYDDVAIKIVPSIAPFCDDGPSPPWNDVSHPEHCLALNFPAGLVIEGHGGDTVFRSPVWVAPYRPAHVLDIFRREFPVTLRNLVLDGRKHEQVWPNDGGSAVSWHHSGFAVWNGSVRQEIAEDGLGNDNGVCEAEACTETPGGNHDGDGRCEAGEACSGPGGSNDACDTDRWPDAQGCVSTLYDDDGCIHNVEARNFFARGLFFQDARRWIIEDSEFHDIGCVNRGYGFDCPKMESAPDESVSIPGYKVSGNGMTIGEYTSDFQIQHNQVYRTVKYGISLSNGGSSCNGLLLDHEVAHNNLYQLGNIGIHSVSSIGVRLHHNTVDGTTLWGEPTSFNHALNTNGMSLGGLCSDDNDYYENTLSNLAGLGIMWNGNTQMVECDGSGCSPIATLGNTIRDTTIAGTCLEKDAGPGQSYDLGALHLHSGAGGDLFLNDNTLTGSKCGYVVTAYGGGIGVQPLNARISGGSYATGPNLIQISESGNPSGRRCGAVRAQGSGLKIVLDDDTSIVNDTSDPEEAFPKACIALGAKLVIDDEPDDPFADGPYTSSSNYGGTGTIVMCDGDLTGDPDCD